MKVGVTVGVSVGVLVGEGVGVRVSVGVEVGVAVDVGRGVGVGVLVEVGGSEGVFVGSDGVFVGMDSATQLVTAKAISTMPIRVAIRVRVIMNLLSDSGKASIIAAGCLIRPAPLLGQVSLYQITSNCQ